MPPKKTTATKRGRPAKPKQTDFIFPLIATEAAMLGEEPIAVNVEIGGKLPVGNKLMTVYNSDLNVLTTKIEVLSKPLTEANLKEQLFVEVKNLSKYKDVWNIYKGHHLANLYVKVI